MRMQTDMEKDESASTVVGLGDEGKASGLKFGLNTASSIKRRQKLSKPVQMEEDTVESATAMAVSADGTVHTDAKKVEPMVIPLLDSNGNLDNSALQAAAVQALLSGDTQNARPNDADSGVVVPMLVKNRLAGIEELTNDDEKFRFDISKRPEAPTVDTYERMPVEMIGEAMLRGMGWTPGGGVGRDRRKFDPIEFIPRPGRIGLGAKIDDVLPPTHGKRGDKAQQSENGGEQQERRRPLRQGESRDGPKILGGRNADGSFKSKRSVNEKLIELKRRTLEPGADVGVVSGRHMGAQGRVEALLPDNKASVRLTSDALITLSRKHLALLDGKATTSSRNNANGSSSSKRKSRSGGSSDKPASKKRRKEIWIRPNIMVRIVSNKFRDGRFYSQKGRVVDCIGGEECVVELADGRVIEGVRQSHLENVVGRDKQAVQVLRGAMGGEFGQVLRRDAKSQTVLVQLDSSGEAHKFTYDDVALYVGSDRTNL